jgi:tRNA pseudouridine32 synthase/23S rRNA pseudouridine746 synthase
MNLTLCDHRDCFIRFDEPIDGFELPKQFTFPFNYTPHPLCVLAANQLQKHLETQTDWQHDFGISNPVEGANSGKMFGILIVRNPHNEIGFLAAFSGNLAGQNNLPHFVPPVVDLLREDGFYKLGEKEISNINAKIKSIEESVNYQNAKHQYETDKQKAQLELELFKQQMKTARNERAIVRQQADLLDEPLKEQLLDTLKNQSLKHQYDYKQLAKQWDAHLMQLQEALNQYHQQLLALKNERKSQSALLQQKMFNQYQFLNAQGERKGVCSIFEEAGQKTPPAAAGDCAAPKLLQYAYTHGMQPLAMGEFWWGQSPKTEVRRHKHFYPACRSKCEPILGHMLVGLDVEPNPALLQSSAQLEPEIIFDDEYLVVINKPSGLLSVPGKTDAPSVLQFIRERYPTAEGPIIVHRLDMSTSGLMVVAKDTATYHNLQKQFLNHTVKKQYVALLDGIIANDEGTIELPLRVDLDNRPHQLVCYDYGKPAITHWKVLERVNNRTRIQFFPITGRTHQLRVHAAHRLGLNCPIVGDELYGKKEDRLHLHAENIEFNHPQNGKRVSFTQKAAF